MFQIKQEGITMKDQNNLEYIEVKRMLSQMATMLKMIIPNKVSVSYLAESTNKTRQSVRQYLINNFEPDKDFWNEGGKTYVSKDVAISILSRSNNNQMLAA